MLCLCFKLCSSAFFFKGKKPGHIGHSSQIFACLPRWLPRCATLDLLALSRIVEAVPARPCPPAPSDLRDTHLDDHQLHSEGADPAGVDYERWRRRRRRLRDIQLARATRVHAFVGRALTDRSQHPHLPVPRALAVRISILN